MHPSHGQGVEYLSRVQVKWPPKWTWTLNSSSLLNVCPQPFSHMLPHLTRSQTRGKVGVGDGKEDGIAPSSFLCWFTGVSWRSATWCGARSFSGVCNTTELSSFLPSDFLFRNSWRLLWFLLTSDGLNFFFFFLACSATAEAGFSDSLVSKEKEKPVPVVRLKENIIPWLVSAWQNSMHLRAMGDRSPLEAAVISEAYFWIKNVGWDLTCFMRRNMWQTLPWIVLLALSVSIDLLSSSARVTSVKFQKHHFWPQKGPLWSFWAKNGLPNGQTDIHRRSEGFKSYLRIWGWYGQIKLIISETEKWGSCGCSVKKADFEVTNGPKLAMAAAWKLPMQSCQHKKVVFLVSSHDATKSFGGCIQKNDFAVQKHDFWSKNMILAQKRPTLGIFGPKTTCRVTKWALT